MDLYDILFLFIHRISGTDWLEEVLPDQPSWRVEDTVKLAGILADHGVDVLDVSAGGAHSKQKVRGGIAYQAPFAEAVKKAHGDKIIVTSVGTINTGHIAQGVLDKVRTRPLSRHLILELNSYVYRAKQMLSLRGGGSRRTRDLFGLLQRI